MPMQQQDPRLLTTEALAYLGDCIVELCVRSFLLEKGLCRSRELNRAALSYVSAPRQADAMRHILPLLSENETAVYRRAHNTGHLQNVPKSATVGQYRAATGMEALFGYLWLSGDTARIRALFCVGYPDAEGADLGLPVSLPKKTDDDTENGSPSV